MGKARPTGDWRWRRTPGRVDPAVGSGRADDGSVVPCVATGRPYGAGQGVPDVAVPACASAVGACGGAARDMDAKPVVGTGRDEQDISKWTEPAEDSGAGRAGVAGSSCLGGGRTKRWCWGRRQ